MSESLLVTYCAPTLAGLKTGNLFNCTCSGRRQAEETVRQWNRTLNRRVCSDHALQRGPSAHLCISQSKAFA